jgi:hypothetical protein
MGRDHVLAVAVVVVLLVLVFLVVEVVPLRAFRREMRRPPITIATAMWVLQIYGESMEIFSLYQTIFSLVVSSLSLFVIRK